MSRKSVSLYRIFLIAFLILFGDSCSRQPSPSRNAADIPVVVPQVIRSIPHDTLAFTQGLVYHRGLLYESTGAPEGRESKLRLIKAADGAVIRELVVPGTFAEGLAIMNDRIIQLTWQHQKALVYSFPDLKFIGTLAYEGEGWGLAGNGQLFVMSNGSASLSFRDNSFAVKRDLNVFYKGRQLEKLNELEWVGEHIYANVWYSTFIFDINEKGIVQKVVDCSGFLQMIQPAGENDVLNGIAYNDSTGTFFITGKNWRKIFEVKFP